jgi:exodeoxyribonuclease VII large subunit
MATRAAATVTLPSEPRRTWTVSAVVRAADRAIREKTGPLWVRGEVSGWKRARTGHCYFTLKDDRAELCCTLWSQVARRLPMLPEDGMQVDVLGQLGIYARRGQFQLDVARVETTGAGGLWQLARERLIQRLRGEGLLDEERKRPLPPCPDRVGIVTSAQSAAFHDMHRVLRRRGWWVPVLVSHCGVEGAESAEEIAAAIRRFGRTRAECPVDVVVVARGGGSMESLWGFNMEPVARAIAECPVPVISAVGHETDYTVADLVADHRAATPTAGAERAVPEGREIALRVAGFPGEARQRVGRVADRREERLASAQEALEGALSRRMARLEGGVEAAALHLEARSPRRTVERLEERALRASEELHGAVRRRMHLLERRLAAEAGALDARSPLRVLARGYALLSDEASSRSVRSITEVRPGQALHVRLADGSLRVRAEQVEPESLLPPEP